MSDFRSLGASPGGTVYVWLCLMWRMSGTPFSSNPSKSPKPSLPLDMLEWWRLPFGLWEPKRKNPLPPWFPLLENYTKKIFRKDRLHNIVKSICRTSFHNISTKHCLPQELWTIFVTSAIVVTSSSCTFEAFERRRNVGHHRARLIEILQKTYEKISTLIHFSYLCNTLHNRKRKRRKVHCTYIVWWGTSHRGDRWIRTHFIYHSCTVQTC